VNAVTYNNITYVSRVGVDWVTQVSSQPAVCQHITSYHLTLRHTAGILNDSYQ